jgi:hypothetical protein
MPGQLKTLEGLDLEPSSIQGTVDFTFKYRSDDAPCWRDWSSFQLCAKDSDCPPADCNASTYRKSYRSRVTLPKPDVACNTDQSRPADLGLRNQVRWEITGSCELKQMLLKSRVQQQPSFDGCTPDTATCTEEVCCPVDNNFLSDPVA